MALPKFVQPQYEIEIPSTGKKVSFRPFTVKEEKALLLAQQSEDTTNMVTTLKEVIHECMLKKIKVDDLATFDLEYLFCQLRGKSVGEIIQMKVKCDTCTDEKAIAAFELDITKVPVKKNKDHVKKIDLFDNVGVVMKYPDFGLLRKMKGGTGKDVKVAFQLVADCVDYVYNDDEVWLSKDQEKGDVQEFLESLTSPQYKKVLEFFETMPVLEKEISYTCPVCKKQYTKVLSGLESFFS